MSIENTFNNSLISYIKNLFYHNSLTFPTISYSPIDFVVNAMLPSPMLYTTYECAVVLMCFSILCSFIFNLFQSVN